MSHRQPAPASGKHSTEPEIIPPSAAARFHDSDATWVSLDERGTHRIYATRLRPFSLTLLMLGIGLLAALVLVLAIGTFLIWISLGALLVTTTIYSRCCGNGSVDGIRMAGGYSIPRGKENRCVDNCLKRMFSLDTSTSQLR